MNESASKSKIISEQDVIDFARLTGDNNPIYLDEEFAKTTRFKTRIAHGIIVAGHISAIIANDLHGKGSIYLSQSLYFKAPVFLGDKIRTEISVISHEGTKYILECKWFNSTENVVLEGIAKVLKDD